MQPLKEVIAGVSASNTETSFLITSSLKSVTKGISINGDSLISYKNFLLVGAAGDLTADFLDEGVEVHRGRLALAVADRDVAGLGLLGAQHQHRGHAVPL